MGEKSPQVFWKEKSKIRRDFEWNFLEIFPRQESPTPFWPLLNGGKRERSRAEFGKEFERDKREEEEEKLIRTSIF